MTNLDNTKFTGIKETGEWQKLTVDERKPLGILQYAAHDFVHKLPFFHKMLGFWSGVVIPDLIGVFLYKIVPTNPDIPEFHWIVAGPKWPYADWDGKIDHNEVRNRTYSGLPHAYIWTGYPEFADPDSAPNPASALDSYVGVIGEWVKAVQSNGDLSHVYPVEVPSGKSAIEYAADVARLLDKIEKEILPKYVDEINVSGGKLN